MIKRGKDGKIFEVNRDCVKKVFRRNKNPQEIIRECEFQRRAAKASLAPPIVRVDQDDTGHYYIVMQKMNHTLMDEIRKQNDLSEKWQREMIRILHTLDKMHIFHGDISPLNFMVYGNKLYIIDFGMSREMDDSFVKKFGRHANTTLGITAFIMRLREFVPSFSPHILETAVFDCQRNKIEI